MTYVLALSTLWHTTRERDIPSELTSDLHKWRGEAPAHLGGQRGAEVGTLIERKVRVSV